MKWQRHSPRAIVIIAVVASLSLFLPRTAARPVFVQRIPNGASVLGVRALGHQSPNGGGATNVFGAAFEMAGLQWTMALCQADSDGDGATNGEELGDPCCAWQPGATVAMRSAVSPSHPGVPNAFSVTQVAAMRCEEDGLAAISGNGTAQTSAPVIAKTSAPVERDAGAGAGAGSAVSRAPVAPNSTANATEKPPAATRASSSALPPVAALRVASAALVMIAAMQG